MTKTTNPNYGNSHKEKQLNTIIRTASVAVLVALGLALRTQAAEDAGPTVPDRAALDREMIELNGRIEQSAQTIPASGQLVVLSNGWDRPLARFNSGGQLMIGNKTYDHGLYCILLGGALARNQRVGAPNSIPPPRKAGTHLPAKDKGHRNSKSEPPNTSRTRPCATACNPYRQATAKALHGFTQP